MKNYIKNYYKLPFLIDIKLELKVKRKGGHRNEVYYFVKFEFDPSEAKNKGSEKDFIEYLFTKRMQIDIFDSTNQ